MAESKITFRLLILSLLFLWSGCAPHIQYRTSLEPCTYSKDEKACRDSTFEEDHGRLLAFVEFDDQGALWKSDQLSRVVTRLQKEAEENANGILVLLFVHGWKHNASFDDSNVQMIRETLRVIQYLEKSTGSNRKVIGIYAGWRGLSLKIPWIENTTFWDRKNTAHQVGHGGLTELLVRIEAVRTQAKVRADKAPKLKFLIVGHSFGGAAAYAALDQILVERAVEQRELLGSNHNTGGFADLVLLVNPAFEAARYALLRDVYVRESGQTNVVDLAIFTSKTDLATKIAFPIGRFFSTIFHKYKNADERQQDRTAVGHYQPFITHDLNLIAPKQPDSNETKVREGSFRPDELETLSGNIRAARRQKRSVAPGAPEQVRSTPQRVDETELNSRHTGDHFPAFVVSVDKAIIPDHSTINKKPFIRFLIGFLSTFSNETTPEEGAQ